MGSRIDSEKLGKIIAMMGSDNSGERANAARAFHRQLTAAGYDQFDQLEMTYGSRPAVRDKSLGAIQTRIWERKVQDAEKSLKSSLQDLALRNYEVSVLRQFVGNMVEHTVDVLVQEEEQRLRNGGKWRDARQVGGWPSWFKSKAKGANP